jgi:hypothetical protein
MSRELLIAERLNTGRLLLRGLGASLVLGELIGFSYLMVGLVRASNGYALPGWNVFALGGLAAWAVDSPVAAVSLMVAFACPSIFVLIALTWLPTRRKFKFDRANAYEIVGRFRVRHRLEDIEVLAGPPRLMLAGKSHHISRSDWDRVTGFYRGLANERPGFVRSAAMGSVDRPRSGLLQALGARVA